MAKLIVKVPVGNYENSDAINRLIGYISTENHHPVLIGGYGFFPVTVANAIDEFNRKDSAMSKFEPSQRKVWHLIYAFDITISYSLALFIASRVALYCHRKGFLVFYGLHSPDSNNKQRGFHIHFCIQYYNYNFYKSNLEYGYFLNILDKLSKDLIKTFPNITINMEVPSYA